MILDKKQMTEEDIKLQYIAPAILSKWGLDRMTTETKVTDGRVNLRGNFVFREKPKKADYVLYLSPNKPIAIFNLYTVDLIQRYQEERSSLNAEIDRVLSEIMEKLKGNISRENIGEFLGDRFPFGAAKVSAKEK